MLKAHDTMNTQPVLPGVSVLIPVFNGRLYLAEAINSILAQSRPIQEILVIDDGSEDDSAAIAAAFTGVRVLRKEHSGIAGTLNLGLAEARFDHIAFLDADDRWLPEKNAQQQECLAAQPDLDGVFGAARQFRMTRPEPGPENEVPVAEVPGASKSGALIRKRAFERIGPFTEAAHDFIEWHGRALHAGLRFLTFDTVMFERRLHFSNYGLLNRDKQRQSYFNAIRARLAQRRGPEATSNPPRPSQ